MENNVLLDAAGDLLRLAARFKFSADDRWAPHVIKLVPPVQTLFKVMSGRPTYMGYLWAVASHIHILAHFSY